MPSDRAGLVADMEWLTPNSGTSFGLGGLAASFAWQKRGPEMKTVVVPRGPHTIYSDDELRLLHRFATTHAERYRKAHGTTQGANLVIIEKDVSTDLNGRSVVAWRGNRLSWTSSPLLSPSLPESIAFFANDDIELGSTWALLSDGRMGRVVSEVPYSEYRDSGYRDLYVLRDHAGQSHRLGNRSPVIHASSQEDLHQQILMALVHRCQGHQTAQKPTPLYRALVGRGSVPGTLAEALSRLGNPSSDADYSRLWAERPLSYFEIEELQAQEGYKRPAKGSRRKASKASVVPAMT